MNIQATESRDYSRDGSVEVHSIFDTIQGEGPFAGTPAIFVRLAGCNLRCPFCDTDYTKGRIRMTLAEVVERVNGAAGTDLLKRRTRLVVITGGEPFRQSLRPLVMELLKNNYTVQVETNGLYYDPDFPYGLVTIVCSPKTPAISGDLAIRVDAFKYVVQAGHIAQDGLPEHPLGQAAQRVARPPYGAGWNREVYLQPLDEKDATANANNLEACIQAVRTHGHRLCLQLHKTLNLP